MTALRLVGGRALLPGEGLVDAPVTIDGGLIGDSGGRELDVSGHLVLPGIIDLHGDGFERNLEPRPRALFPFAVALANTDAEMAANGVTTAMLAQSFSWEGAMRSPDFTETLVRELQQARPGLRTDLRIQIRYETHMVEEADRMLALLESGGAGYVIFNDHLPTAHRVEEELASLAGWAANNNRKLDDFADAIRGRLARAPEVPASLERIAARLTALGVPFGSHDDATPELRARYNAIGAHIAEFPTTEAAAAEARRLGNPILMGAPNVVRGGSASGNVSAADLVAQDLCDVLVSDYYTPALAAAAWRLVDDGLRDIAAAWEMISTNAADAIGMDDRGRLMPGKRADLVVVDAGTRRVEACLVAGEIAHLSGRLATRWTGSAVRWAARRSEFPGSGGGLL